MFHIPYFRHTIDFSWGTGYTPSKILPVIFYVYFLFFFLMSFIFTSCPTKDSLLLNHLRSSVLGVEKQNPARRPLSPSRCPTRLRQVFIYRQTVVRRLAALFNQDGWLRAHPYLQSRAPRGTSLWIKHSRLSLLRDFSCTVVTFKMDLQSCFRDFGLNSSHSALVG